MLTEINCEVCKNERGWVEWRDTDRGRYEFWIPCKCAQRVKSLKLIGQSGLAEQLKEFQFDKFKTEHGFQKNMFDTAQDFLTTGINRWFVVLGKSGAGKTHICTAVCGELLKRGLSVRYLRWAVELKELKSLANTDTYFTKIDDYFFYDVIYIDDLFKRGKTATPSDADIKLAFELIDTARAQNKTLIISGEDLLESLINIDEAIAGRIKQKAGQFLVQIKGDGKNYRLGGSNT